MTNIKSISCGDHTLDFKYTKLMGILNVTPDSFSDGGLFNDVTIAIAHAKQMAAEGADIIDIGGESSRPGSQPLSEQEELKRILPIVKKLVKEISIPISIDTYKPQVAKACLKEGAHMINDITGLLNQEMMDVVVQYDVPVVIMHMKDTPKIMQANPVYGNVVTEVKEFLLNRSTVAKNAGIKQIIIDPGIGFGKTLEHNLQLLRNLREFTMFGYPLLVGPSRKMFIGAITGRPVTDRLEGTLAAVTIAIMNGANMVRVHDVKACKAAVQVVDAIRGIS